MGLEYSARRPSSAGISNHSFLNVRYFSFVARHDIFFRNTVLVSIGEDVPSKIFARELGHDSGRSERTTSKMVSDLVLLNCLSLRKRSLNADRAVDPQVVKQLPALRAVHD